MLNSIRASNSSTIIENINLGAEYILGMRTNKIQGLEVRLQQWRLGEGVRRFGESLRNAFYEAFPIVDPKYLSPSPSH